mgnify:CR=1 FL=1
MWAVTWPIYFVVATLSDISFCLIPMISLRLAAVCYALFYQPKIFHGFPAKRSIEGFILADIMVSADSVWCFYVSFINREHVSNQKHSLLRSNQSNMIIDTFACRRRAFSLLSQFSFYNYQLVN